MFVNKAETFANRISDAEFYYLPFTARSMSGWSLSAQLIAKIFQIEDIYISDSGIYKGKTE